MSCPTWNPSFRESTPTVVTPVPVTGRRASVLAGLSLLLLVRWLYVLICPLDLVPDEAYYWDWSRQLDWGYFSKPPLIAWTIAASTAWCGTTEFAIRLPAALFGTIGLWATYELGRRLYGHAAGVRALVLVAASPGSLVACLLMTIDAPFLALWALSLYCLWRLVEGERADWRWVIPSIIATGGALLAKQTAIGLFPLLALFLLTNSRDRHKLVSIPVLTWGLGSLLVVTPVLWWNATHAWVTLSHTSAHFLPGSRQGLLPAVRLAELIASQGILISPVTFALASLVFLTLLKQFPRWDARQRFLICFGGLPWLAFLPLSCVQRVQPNWPVAFHLTSLILLAAWSESAFDLSTRLDRWRHWTQRGLGVSLALTACLAVTPFLISRTGLAGSSIDLTLRLRGWSQLGHQVGLELKHLDDSQALVIAATARGPVSELAFYLPGQPRVYRWNAGEVIDSQHDLWGGPRHAEGRDALIVTDAGQPVPSRLAEAFATVSELSPLTISLGHEKSRQFRVFHARQLSAWPDFRPAALSSPDLP